MYCFLIESTGQSWGQVRDDWDLPRLSAWVSYCAKRPTVRSMVQAYLGIETKKSQTEGPQENLMAVLAQMPGAVERKRSG